MNISSYIYLYFLKKSYLFANDSDFSRVYESPLWNFFNESTLHIDLKVTSGSFKAQHSIR